MPHGQGRPEAALDGSARSHAEKAKAAGFDIEPDHAQMQWGTGGFMRFWLGPPGKQTAADLTIFMRIIPRGTGRPLDAGKTVSARLSGTPLCGIPNVGKWANVFATQDAEYRDVPRRLEYLLTGGDFPPPTRS